MYKRFFSYFPLIIIVKTNPNKLFYESFMKPVILTITMNKNYKLNMPFSRNVLKDIIFHDFVSTFFNCLAFFKSYSFIEKKFKVTNIISN